MTTTPSTSDHDHRVRGPLNSWALRVLEGHVHRQLGAVRSELLGGLEGEVLEVGPGNGPTFAYLPSTVRTVHAVEPNPHFHRRLRRAAAAQGLDLVVHATPGEAIDLPDDSVDAAIVSWVLCTVADPDAVLAEVRRVLRPGGRLVFFEHVRAPHGTPVRGVQRVLRRPWRWVFEGCHVDRDTAGVIHRAGFRTVAMRPLRLTTPFVPIQPQIAGTATV